MFEIVIELWQNYLAEVSSDWCANDPRHHLAFEVHARLRQLDICLQLVTEQENLLKENSENDRDFANYIVANGPKINSGELPIDEYITNLPKSTSNPQLMISAFDRARLFAESFYLVAWRLRQILNSREPRHFPGIARIEAKCIRDVRNHLIEHPDHQGDDAKYEQHFVFIDTGPVLKSSSFLIRDGHSMADCDSIDRGLRPNASEFEQELRLAITNRII